MSHYGRQQAAARGLLNQKVRYRQGTGASAEHHTVLFRGFCLDEHGEDNSAVIAYPADPMQCYLVHYSRIVELNE